MYPHGVWYSLRSEGWEHVAACCNTFPSFSAPALLLLSQTFLELTNPMHSLFQERDPHPVTEVFLVEFESVVTRK